MTADVRPDGRLNEILEELYLGRVPDYRDEVVAGDWIRRDDDPTIFWTAVSLIFTMAVLAIGAGAIAGYASRPL